MFQNETVRWQPSYNYESVKLNHDATPADFYDARSDGDTRGFPGSSIFWESVVARCEYKNKNLSEITLHPIDLGHGRPRSQRGRPVLASGNLVKKTLHRMDRLSRPFGVGVAVRNDVGTLRM